MHRYRVNAKACALIAERNGHQEWLRLREKRLGRTLM
jgi:hypothetical protein